MRVDVAGKTHPPRISGAAPTVAALAPGFVDARRGARTNQARTHRDDPRAAGNGGFRTLQARGTT